MAARRVNLTELSVLGCRRRTVTLKHTLFDVFDVTSEDSLPTSKPMS